MKRWSGKDLFFALVVVVAMIAAAVGWVLDWIAAPFRWLFGG